MTFWLITGIIFLSSAAVQTFRSLPVPSTLIAYIGLWMSRQSEIIPVSGNEMLFWGIATVIIIGIESLSPSNSDVISHQRKYIAGGTLTGMIAGVLLTPSGGTVTGAVIGGILGFIAYSRTPNGRCHKMPQLSVAAGAIIPIVTTFSIIGAALKSVVSMP